MIKKTPLYEWHVSNSKNVVPFGGFFLPIYYSSILEEHLNVRTKAGLFDVSHMGEFIISGPSAEEFIQLVTINDISKLKNGKAQYNVMCNEDGGIIDDVIIYKKSNEYMMVVNSSNIDKNFQWLESVMIQDVNLKNKSMDYGLIAIQGPYSRKILQPLINKDLLNLRFYHFIDEVDIVGSKTLISRTGYTGELGYEIYASPGSIKKIWEKLIEEGSRYGLLPSGLGCRDTLRLEMNYLLYGNDINQKTNPIEAGLGWITKFDKGDFIGKESIMQTLQNACENSKIQDPTEVEMLEAPEKIPDSSLLELYNPELEKLKPGGHDPVKIYSAYNEAVHYKGKPTVVLARTIKGYGLGDAGEGKNITHNQKKLSEKETLYFRDRFQIPLSDKEAEKAPFFDFKKNSSEFEYLINQREKLGGFIPKRANNPINQEVPAVDIFNELLNGSEEREVSTTMTFVRLLTLLTKDKKIGKNVVPIIPDEARTFGMDPLFRQLGIYSSQGQLYDPVDSDQFLYYKESKEGQILEEGINEAGAISSFIAAGMSYSTYGFHMVPFYIYYSMFGFQRVWDFIWAAGDMRVRGFLLGGTAGRTTLNGEGLQHQDGHSHLAAAATPNIKAYDLSYGYEIATVIHRGMVEMVEEEKDVIYYLTLENENYKHPPIPDGVGQDIIKGLYKIKSSKKPTIRLLGSGPLVREALEAANLLKKDWGLEPGVWNVTSFSELRREAEEVERWNLMNPDKKEKTSHLEKSLRKHKVPTVAVSDYIKMVAEQIGPYVPGPYYALGTDGFGRSETRENLRRFFEIDRHYIVLTALRALVNEGLLDLSVLSKAMKKYNLDPEKPSPITV